MLSHKDSWAVKSNEMWTGNRNAFKKIIIERPYRASNILSSKIKERQPSCNHSAKLNALMEALVQKISAPLYACPPPQSGKAPVLVLHFVWPFSIQSHVMVEGIHRNGHPILTHSADLKTYWTHLLFKWGLGAQCFSFNNLAALDFGTAAVSSLNH